MSSRKTDKAIQPVNPFHAVEIKPGKGCCEAALALKGVRHLSRDKPPRLPLESCTRMDVCDCRYVHHEDRRAGDRRRGWAIVETRMGQKLLEQQREPDKIRKSRGRRSTD